VLARLTLAGMDASKETPTGNARTVPMYDCSLAVRHPGRGGVVARDDTQMTTRPHGDAQRSAVVGGM
jgi:hypothetical protein